MAAADRLTALDTSFLHIEDAGHAHMHVAGVLIFEGDPPAYDDLLRGFAAKLHLVPRYRQRLAFVPGGQARPVWIDDAHFDLRYHVRRTALPSPHSEAELAILAGRVFSQRLDREKPLWETWLVENLEGGRFALLTKTHHCLVDGISGVDITTVLFDLDPNAALPTEVQPWTPRPTPSGAGLIAQGARDAVGGVLGMAGSATRLLTSPRSLGDRAATAAAGVGALVGQQLDPAPDTPYNVGIGPHRRFAWQRASLAEVKAIKNALGGTVNDIVLASVSGMIRRHLEARGEEIPETIRLMVPVSVRTSEERGALGNRVTSVFPDLPLAEPDPLIRLSRISATMDAVKRSKKALGAQFLVDLVGFAPPTIMALGARSFSSRRMFNLTVTNVPGPQFPIYMAGSRLVDLLPMVPLAEDHALGVAVMSYDGGLDFGLIGDADAMPDIDSLPAHLEASIAELAALAGVAHGRREAATTGAGARQHRRPARGGGARRARKGSRAAS